ncbi:hypothetical protein MMC14_010319 [Varicellaria rhodocarpa]|nr:hypothetical protein [Varicellaria rhodocarpa]
MSSTDLKSGPFDANRPTFFSTWFGVSTYIFTTILSLPSWYWDWTRQVHRCLRGHNHDDPISLPAVTAGPVPIPPLLKTLTTPLSQPITRADLHDALVQAGAAGKERERLRTENGRLRVEIGELTVDIGQLRARNLALEERLDESVRLTTTSQQLLQQQQQQERGGGLLGISP